MGGAAGGGASLLARSRPAGVGLGGFFDTTGGAVGGGVGCFSSVAVGPALSSSFLSGSGCSVSLVIIDRAATSDSSALFCFLFCSSACHGLRPGSSSFGFGGGGFAFGFAFGGGALLTSGIVAAAAGCCTDGCDGGGGCEGGGGGGGSDEDTDGCVVRVAVFLSGMGGGPPVLTFGFCWTGGVAAACSDTGAVVTAAASCLGDSSS